MGILSELAGSAGRNALVAISDGRATHYWGDFSSQRFIQSTLASRTSSDWYFALASYAPNVCELTKTKGRRADNTTEMRSLWLDIDAGAAKVAKHGDAVYPDQPEAISDLSRVLADSQLVKPTHVISSGLGLHVYWAFDTALPPDSWRKLAAKLQAVLLSHSLRIDSTRTLDAASILRVPGTRHCGANRTVEVLKRAAPLRLEALLTSLSSAKLGSSTRQHGRQAPVGRRERATTTATQLPSGAVGQASAFKQQAAKHLTAQRLLQSTERSRAPLPPDTPRNRARVERLLSVVSSACGYERWRDVLWAVMSLGDAGWDKAWIAATLHEWSEAGADANDDTWEVAFTKVWHSDERTAGQRRIAIGSLVKWAVDADPSLDGFHFASADDADGARESPMLATTSVSYPRPAMPKGFFHHKTEPGLFFKQRLETDDGVEIVTRHLLRDDAYVTDRIENADGSVLVYICTQENPNRPVKKIQVTGDTLFGEWRDFRKIITAQGIWPAEQFRGHGEILMRYFQAQAEEIKQAREATPTVTSYGWRSRGAGQPDMDFAFGNVMYHPDGTTDVMIPDKTLHLYAPEVAPHGTVDDWKVLPALYAHPGLEYAQLPVLLSMGAPLYRFTNCVGGVCMLHSEEGAAGKTSALRVAGSVWAYSEAGSAYVGGRSTANAMFLKMGMMGSLPCMFDEQTQQSGRVESVTSLRDFILRSSGAVDKARMTASGNTFRESPRWSTFALMTANTSIRTVCSGFGTSHAEIRRGLDVLFPSLASATDGLYAADHAFNAMSHILPANYGVAGAALAAFYTTNQQRMRALVKQKVEMFGSDFAPAQRAAMSFPIAMCAVAAAARDVAAELDLVHYDDTAFTKFCQQLLARQDEAVTASETSAEDVLNEYLRNSGDHIFTVRKSRTGQWLMPVRPRAPFAGRWDATHGKLHLSIESVRQFCVERSIDVQKVETWLVKRGALERRERVNYAEGLPEFAAGKVYSYVINTRKARLPTPEIPEGGAA